MTATANPWSGDRADAGETGADRLFLEAIGAALGRRPRRPTASASMDPTAFRPPLP